MTRLWIASYSLKNSVLTDWKVTSAEEKKRQCTVSIDEVNSTSLLWQRYQWKRRRADVQKTDVRGLGGRGIRMSWWHTCSHTHGHADTCGHTAHTCVHVDTHADTHRYTLTSSQTCTCRHTSHTYTHSHTRTHACLPSHVPAPPCPSPAPPSVCPLLLPQELLSARPGGLIVAAHI